MIVYACLAVESAIPSRLEAALVFLRETRHLTVACDETGCILGFLAADVVCDAPLHPGPARRATKSRGRGSHGAIATPAGRRWGNADARRKSDAVATVLRDRDTAEAADAQPAPDGATNSEVTRPSTTDDGPYPAGIALTR